MIYALNRQLAANAIRSHLLENSGSIGSSSNSIAPIAEIMGSCGYDCCNRYGAWLYFCSRAPQSL